MISISDLKFVTIASKSKAKVCSLLPYRIILNDEEETVVPPQNKDVIELIYKKEKKMIKTVKGMAIYKKEYIINMELLTMISRHYDIVVVPIDVINALWALGSEVREGLPNVVSTNPTVDTMSLPPPDVVTDIDNWYY